MSKFKEAFSEPMSFSNGAYVVSGFIDKKLAREMISIEVDYGVNLEQIESGFVKFGFAPESIMELAGENCWYQCGEDKKGAQPVWIYG